MTNAEKNQRVVISQVGPSSVLKVLEEPLPAPGPGQVRVRMEAAGVSLGDVLQRNGLFFAGAPAIPYSPGYDVVGVVDAVGPGVDRVRVGERVAALTIFGSYSRFLCLAQDEVVGGIPEHLDAAQTVALVLNYTTAYQMLTREVDLKEGQSILVYGGSGGVGTALLDLARTRGMVAAAAVSRRWHEKLQGQAPLLFDEKDPDSAERLRRFQPEGFDAVFDPIGGSHVWKSRQWVKKGGTLVAFGISGAIKPNGGSDRWEVLRLGLLLAFSKVWPRPRVILSAIDQRVKSQRKLINQDITALVDLLARGAISPQIGATFGLKDARRAHDLLESRNNVGKIVLVP